MSSNMQNTPPQREKQTLSDFHSAEESESKFWRKVKKDPVVPLGMAGFGLIVLGAIIGYNRRDRSKPTSTYWIRTRVYAQGFVVSLLTAAAIYQAYKVSSEPTDIHGHSLNHNGHGHHGHGHGHGHGHANSPAK